MELTTALDRAIKGLVDPLPDDVSVVAIGGYGRRELSPYSDVDLMLLHRLDDPSEIAASLFRPLWDAKLRLGHSVRTPDEAAAAARERVDTHTTLLTGRLIAGDVDLFEKMTGEIAAVTRARPLRRHLVAAERERRAHSPHLLMAADLKLGRGGLRTIHGFDWERRREALIGRFSEPAEGIEAAREVLVRVRNALHAGTGRAYDVFSPELREPAARWLGLDPFDMSQELIEAMGAVDRLAARRWPEVVEDRARGVWGRLVGKPAPLSADSEPSLDELVWMLETGDQGRHAFERYREGGHLDRILPEWEAVRALPQLAPFHEHPVGEHLWRTSEEMQALIADGGHYQGIAREVGDTAALLLASFLHDIGKGHGGDHATIGADIARRVCERMGMDAKRIGLIEHAVRHHLLLPITATRRDLDDPEVIQEIVGTVGSLRRLQTLYLLAVADSKATGASMWGEWKAILLRTLFLRCAARFGAQGAGTVGTSRDEVLTAAGAGATEPLRRHLDGMPSPYLRGVTAGDVLWHHALVEGMSGASNAGLRRQDAMCSAAVVGRAAPGFRRHVAQALAANGIDVLQARMHTREDGIVVDSYVVSDDRTGEMVDDDKWGSFLHDLEAALGGKIDIGAKLAMRAAAYRAPPGPDPAARASIDPASQDLVITVECADRIGRLSEILSVLGDMGLEIRLAKIDSRQGGVVDSFHVAATSVGNGELRGIERRIADAIVP